MQVFMGAVFYGHRKKKNGKMPKRWAGLLQNSAGQTHD